MAYHSITEASQLVKRSKQSLYRDIKQGKLTVTPSVTHEKQVETAELIRVYGEIYPTSETHETVSMLQHETTQTDTLNETLSSLIEYQKLQIEHLKQRLDDKQQHIDSLNRAIQVLEHKTPEPLPTKKKWWKF